MSVAQTPGRGRPATARAMARALLLALCGWLPGPQAWATDETALAQKVALCVACHGANGNSPTPAVPSLAGQPKQFITTQLVMFREGNRQNAQMSPMAAGLSNADISALGSYFAAQALVPASTATSAERAVAGRQLAERLMCVQCHGAALKGQQHIPRLAGQQAEYLRVQLRGFKAGTRFDMDGNMTSAAKGLAADEIDALADYLASLP